MPIEHDSSQTLSFSQERKTLLRRKWSRHDIRQQSEEGGRLWGKIYSTMWYGIYQEEEDAARQCISNSRSIKG